MQTSKHNCSGHLRFCKPLQLLPNPLLTWNSNLHYSQWSISWCGGHYNAASQTTLPLLPLPTQHNKPATARVQQRPLGINYAWFQRCRKCRPPQFGNKHWHKTHNKLATSIPVFIRLVLTGVDVSNKAPNLGLLSTRWRLHNTLHSMKQWRSRGCILLRWRLRITFARLGFRRQASPDTVRLNIAGIIAKRR